MADLTIKEFSEKNAARCERDFHRKISLETLPLHALALGGEVGELQQEIKRMMDEGTLTEERRIRIGNEISDIQTYADLCAQHCGLDPEAILKQKFNEVSDRVGSDIKL